MVTGYEHKVYDTFQFTPLREGRQTRWRFRPRWARFQFTPLREGRPCPTIRRGCGQGISIHAPPRGATPPSVALALMSVFQFTPLREGRPVPAPPAAAQSLPISIHAPPRGATEGDYVKQDCIIISIHAPPRGATDSGNVKPCVAAYFNSRPSARGDTAQPGRD